MLLFQISGLCREYYCLRNNFFLYQYHAINSNMCQHAINENKGSLCLFQWPIPSPQHQNKCVHLVESFLPIDFLTIKQVINVINARLMSCIWIILVKISLSLIVHKNNVLNCLNSKYYKKILSLKDYDLLLLNHHPPWSTCIFFYKDFCINWFEL